MAARAAMACAALCSGICLANAGLGAVHGLVAPSGGFPIRHGMVCGTLLAAPTRANIAALAARAPGSPALARYAEAGRILAGDRALPDDQRAGRAAGDAGRLDDRPPDAAPRRTSASAPRDLPGLVAESRGSSMRTNPIALADAEIAGILAACL